MATNVKIASPPEREGLDARVNCSEKSALSADLLELFQLISERSFRTGSWTLASGKQSTLYFNMKPTMMHARGAELAARALLQKLETLGADYVSGLEMGAVPVIGAMAAISSAEHTPIKTTFVRKQPKKHGTKDLIEGLGPEETLDNKEVVIVDDVATSGGSFLVAVNAVRAEGGIVKNAVCLVDREEGASEFLSLHDVVLHSIFCAREFKLDNTFIG